MTQPNWDDLHTPEQWADELDDHAENVAHDGMYQLSADLRFAAECIRFLSGRVDSAIEANVELRRALRAGIESLGKLPS